MDMVAESAKAAFNQQEQAKGLRIVFHLIFILHFP